MQAEGPTQCGQNYLGIELGSTRIKAVLIDSTGKVLAAGGHSWQSSLQGGTWTYPLAQVHGGLQAAYAELKQNFHQNYAATLRRISAVGVSAMMHGYLAFDAQERQLVEFRTWRNTTTSRAAARLSELFECNIPQRWSIAHLYQAILNGEPHVAELAHITTLAGYIHWQLTGERNLGIGDASGMFPVGGDDWDTSMLKQFDELLHGVDGSHGSQSTQGIQGTQGTQGREFPWKLRDLLPQVKLAGQEAGRLTQRGALMLDPAGDLQPGALLCPAEGDAATGMVATNSVAARTGNVSAGTSIFAMLVLEKKLSPIRREVDLVSTPQGLPVAMVHCNNGCSDIDAWIGLFGEAAELMGARFDVDKLFEAMYRKALEGKPDCAGFLHYGYVAGEDMVELLEGRPLFVRHAGSPLNLADFMRSQIYASLCALRIGLDILMKDEGVRVDDIRGHGGFFKTAVVGQRMMAAATGLPVTVIESAGEGGAWGMALLAYFAAQTNQSSLPEFLQGIFAGRMGVPLPPDPADAAGFEQYLARFCQGLEIERSAVGQPVEK